MILNTIRSRRACFRVALAVATAAIGLPAHGQSFLWPGATTPCNSTLQACINGAIDGAVVLIAINDVSNTGHSGTAIVLPRSVTLTAAPGFQPVFPIGVGIVAEPAIAAEVLVSSITLRNAQLRFRSTAAVATAFGAVRMRLLNDGGSGSNIAIETLGAGPAQIRIHDNEYLRRGGAGNFLSVESRGGVISGEIDFNRVSIPDTSSSAYGILVVASSAGSFDLTVANNEIRSSFAFGAICALSSAPIGTPVASSIRIHSNVFVPRLPGSGSAICIFGGEGPIDARVTHNTIIDHGSAISMVVRPFSPPVATQPISGFVIGNLLAYNGTAFRRDAIAAVGGSAVTNGQNLLFSNTNNFAGSAAATAGSGTVTADPQLYSRTYAYLLAGSPAIGAGNPLAVPGGYLLLDADGSRRLKDVGGGGSVIDIGAYEFGDSWFNVTANGGNSAFNYVRASHPSSDGLPAARVLATPNFSRGTAESNAPFGVFLTGTTPQWAVFNQNNATSMPLGAGYSLLTPATGSGLFLRQVAAGGALGEIILDNPATNGLSEQIVAITANWNPPGSTGVYNDRTTSVAYQTSRWRIRNNDGGPFAGNAAFNVYAQPPSPSAFRHLARPGNIGNQAGPGAYTFIDNSRLAAFACAELMVTPLASFGDRRFDVFRNTALGGRWVIYSTTDMPTDAEFNVVFSPRQTTECGLPMFADGFEG